MLTILATVGLRTLVAVLPLDIQAAMAIRATTILQGTLAVLEIILVPLVKMRNNLRAIEDCKVAPTDTVYDACNLHPLVLSQHCLPALVQHPTFLRRQKPGLLPHGVFSYLG